MVTNRPAHEARNTIVEHARPLHLSTNTNRGAWSECGTAHFGGCRGYDTNRLCHHKSTTLTVHTIP